MKNLRKQCTRRWARWKQRRKEENVTVEVMRNNLLSSLLLFVSVVLLRFICAFFILFCVFCFCSFFFNILVSPCDFLIALLWRWMPGRSFSVCYWPTVLLFWIPLQIVMKLSTTGNQRIIFCTIRALNSKHGNTGSSSSLSRVFELLVHSAVVLCHFAVLASIVLNLVFEVIFTFCFTQSLDFFFDFFELMCCAQKSVSGEVEFTLCVFSNSLLLCWTELVSPSYRFLLSSPFSLLLTCLCGLSVCLLSPFCSSFLLAFLQPFSFAFVSAWVHLLPSVKHTSSSLCRMRQGEQLRRMQRRRQRPRLRLRQRQRQSQQKSAKLLLLLHPPLLPLHYLLPPLLPLLHHYHLHYVVTCCFFSVWAVGCGMQVQHIFLNPSLWTCWCWAGQNGSKLAHRRRHQQQLRTRRQGKEEGVLLFTLLRMKKKEQEKEGRLWHLV